jgi:hypothetical protein
MNESNKSLFDFNVVENYQNLKFFSKPEKLLSYLPIVYSNNYDISFGYIEKVHPFDTRKWAKIFNLLKVWVKKTFKKFFPLISLWFEFFFLKTKFNKSFATLSPTREISVEELKLVHTEEFVDNIRNNSQMIADAAEVWILRYL